MPIACSSLSSASRRIYRTSRHVIRTTHSTKERWKNKRRNARGQEKMNPTGQPWVSNSTSRSLPSIQRYYAYTHSSLECNRYRPDRMLQRVFRFTNDYHGSTTTDEFLFIFNSARVRQRNRARHGDSLFPRFTIPWSIYLLRRTLSATPLSVKLKIGKTESMLTVFWFSDFPLTRIYVYAVEEKRFFNEKVITYRVFQISTSRVPN